MFSDKKYTIKDFDSLFSNCISCNKKLRINFFGSTYISDFYQINYFLDKKGMYNLNLESKYKNNNLLIIDPVLHNYITSIDNIKKVILNKKLYLQLHCKKCNYYVNTSDLEIKNKKLSPIKINNLYFILQDNLKKDISYSLAYRFDEENKWIFNIWLEKNSIDHAIFSINLNDFDLLKYNKEQLLDKFRIYLSMM